MSALWSTTVAPVSVRLDDLEVICRVLECDASDLLVLDPASGPSVSQQSAQPLPAAEAIGEAWANNSSNTGRATARRAGLVRPSLPPV